MTFWRDRIPFTDEPPDNPMDKPYDYINNLPVDELLELWADFCDANGIENTANEDNYDEEINYDALADWLYELDREY